MLQKNTTIVLGAGSSKIFGLPLGNELKTQIAAAIYLHFDDFGRTLERGSYAIADAFRAWVKLEDPTGNGNINPYIVAGREIAEALPVCSSIDDYIERHSGHKIYERCAKLGIAHCILDAEKGSPLRPDPHKIATPDITKLSGCWLDELLQAATRGCRADDLPLAFSRMKVINFNYDRCFEQFAHLWLKRVYKIDDAAAFEAVRSILVIHPYGSIGSLPGMGDSSSIPFGCEPSTAELVRIAENIVTYSESSHDNELVNSIKETMSNAKNLVFLGYAFHPQNMNLLSVHAPPTRPFARHAYASAVGISDVRWELIKGRIVNSLATTSDLVFAYKESESCEKLVQEFSDHMIE